MFYEAKDANLLQEGVWDEKSCVRRVGGFDIDKTNLPSNMTYLTKGSVVAYDKGTGKVVLVKTAKAYAEAASGATSLQVFKGHALKVGDKVAGKAISAIDTSNANYDTLTVAALSAKVAKDAVVADDNAANAIGLVYASKKLDQFPTCSVTLQAYEIQEDTLPYPVNDAIKTALTCRHAWKL